MPKKESDRASIASKIRMNFKKDRVSVLDEKEALPTTSILTFDKPLEKKVVVDPKKLNSLQKAVFDNDAKKFKKLINEEKRDIDKLDTEHRITSLYLAVCLGNRDMAEGLLKGDEKTKRKANPNLQCGKNSRTPLMMVCFTHSYLLLFTPTSDYGG
jgi:hypothetical protein